MAGIMRRSSIPALYPVYQCCRTVSVDLERPLRIAVTGIKKTGKSTLMNALLKQYIVPTAVKVMTYNVNWFHHISCSPDGHEGLVVHLNDGCCEKYDLAELPEFVTKTRRNKAYIDRIHWVDVYLDSPILKEFDLIDTPGLQSLLGKDSQHTRDLLTKEENRPDAILYLVSKGIQHSDVEVVRDFHEITGLMSGINTIAALSRVDELAGQFDDADLIIDDNLERYSDVRYYFSSIFPIAAITAEASTRLSPSDVDNLQRLASMDGIEGFTVTKKKFEEETPCLNKRQRKELCRKLSISGVRLAVRFIKTGADLQGLRDYLYEFSRVGPLKDYLVKHFGKRAEFIQCQKALQQIKDACTRAGRFPDVASDARQALLAIQRDLSSFTSSFEADFQAYYILSDYYNLQDYFEENVWERAKRVLGEYGDSAESRFGIRDGEDIELARQKEKAYWNNVSSRYNMMANLKGAAVAKKIVNLL